MLCEMCGKDVPEVSIVKIEGTVLRLCPNCAKFGKVVEPPPAAFHAPGRTPGMSKGPRRSPMEEKDIFTEMPPLELVPDWSQRIRKAREVMGLTQDQFGVRLSEKSSVIHKLESGAFFPPDAMVRKIEKVLKIRIRAAPETS